MKLTTLILILCSSLALAETPLERERARFEKESAAALAPVREGYKQRLTSALDALTKAGQLDAALDVRTELAKIAGVKPGNDYAPIAGQKFKWGSETIEFLSTGKVRNAGWDSRGLVTSWKHVGNGNIICHIDKGRDNQKIALLQFKPNWIEYSGWSFDGTVIPPSGRARAD